MFLQQVVVSPQELDAIVTRLNTRPVKEVKTGSEASQAKAVKLVYQKDAAKGYKEVYMPLKRVWLYTKQHTKPPMQLKVRWHAIGPIRGACVLHPLPLV